MTPAQLLAQFKKWGVKYVEHSGPRKVGRGWRTHNREGHGEWGPLHGTMNHHTGDDAPDQADIKVLWNGRSDLPGPLCQIGIDDDGVAHMIGWGRANHAGGGDPDVLRAVINESYDDYPPDTHEHQGSSGSVDGNPHFVGKEIMYSGSKKMTPAAYKTAVLIDAAIDDFYKWSEKSNIGHKEWSDWKSDPGKVNMARFRRDVADALLAGPGNWHIGWTPPVEPIPQPQPQVSDKEEDEVVSDVATRIVSKTVLVKFKGKKEAHKNITFDGFAEIPEVLVTPGTANYRAGSYSRSISSATIALKCDFESHSEIYCSVLIVGKGA